MKLKGLAAALLLATGTVWAQPHIQIRFEAGSQRAFLEADPLPTRLAAMLNRQIQLPRDLPIVYRDDRAVNAWYSPNNHSITVSYRLAEVLRGQMEAESARGAMDFILMHELGHALIGELDLPQVGSEENAADEFTTLVCAQALGEEGRRVALAGARAFWLLGDGQYNLAALPFYDEHRLERQRFYTILANLGAADPALRPSLAPIVPYTRLREAQESYPGKVDRWQRLLAGSVETVAPGSGKLKIQAIAPLPLARLAGILERSYRLPRDWVVEQRDARTQFLPLSGYLVYAAGASAEDFLLAFCYGLISDLKLPYTGELGDAAAELAAVLMAGRSDLRPLARSALARYEQLGRAHKSVLDVQYWDATAQPEQRYFQMLGYLYCQDPAGYPEARTRIPAKRLRSIGFEYPRKKRNWARLLSPYQR
ncbi:MAG: hypothetical protein KF760_20625 [Candidatus Eremiobacteraeota bacterium]|nr:hypothetical protein [Candidatus Eremiobacteraeota bacterium]MCW5870445.1 hypothetical protein [Candidatus Eremiobacteraeota bacterium]